MKIAYTCGDVNGIGLEVFFKAIPYLVRTSNHIICNENTLAQYLEKCKLKGTIKDNQIKVGNQIAHIINLEKYSEVSLGEIKADAGILSAESINKALDLVISEEMDALVTLPINKYSIKAANWEFSGHTEMIADRLGENNFNMMLLSNQSKLIPLTIHIPLKEVAQNITQDLIINKVFSLNNTLKKDFLINNPKIAILGLNPHSGDNGIIGLEEIEIIKPAITRLKSEFHINLDGPFSADAYFARKTYKKYDCTVACYHDQGLIPIKMLSREAGVNYTSGLGIIRTSPDHGTAYEIAGKNKANPKSLINSAKLALSVYKNRRKSA